MARVTPSADLSITHPAEGDLRPRPNPTYTVGRPSDHALGFQHAHRAQEPQRKGANRFQPTSASVRRSVGSPTST
eukprot:6579542-Prymnesium_polylepis.2